MAVTQSSENLREAPRAPSSPGKTPRPCCEDIAWQTNPQRRLHVELMRLFCWRLSERISSDSTTPFASLPTLLICPYKNVPVQMLLNYVPLQKHETLPCTSGTHCIDHWQYPHRGCQALLYLPRESWLITF